MAIDPNATVIGSQGNDTVFDSSFIRGHEEDLASWVSRFWPQWRIEGFLGEGSFGRVYEISKQEMGYITTSAAKVIRITERDANPSGFASGAESLEEKVRSAYGEIERMKELSGEPNIVIINESRCEPQSDGRAYVIGMRMELLQGLTERWSQFGGVFPVDEAMKVALDICRALVACHKHGIVHRDVKPQNVFWSQRTGVYKLGDLGASKQMGLRTQMATSIGTMEYAAPEVIACKPYSKNADIYSLGTMLFYMLNHGVKPFLSLDGTGDERLASQMRLEGRPFPDPVTGDRYIADLIRSATAGNPKHRFKTSQAFYNAISAWPGWSQS